MATGMMTTQSSGLTSEFQTYYDKQLLSYAKPQVVTAQFAQKKSFPKNAGANTIRFFRPNAPDRTRVSKLVDGASSNAGEGVPIATYQQISLTPVDVTLSMYGEAVKISDITSETDLFNTLDNSVRMMGEDAGVHADFLCVTEVVTNVNASNKRYAGGAANFAALHALSAANGALQIKDLLGAYTRLTITKAKKPEGREYATIITPQQAYDVMLDTKFVDAGVRGQNQGLFSGEIGRWYGNRILVTTEGWTEDGAGAEGTYVQNAAEPIFTTLVLGREALGAPIMAGLSPFSPSIIVNDKADSGNPLKQFKTAGWKAYWATKMLNDTWAVVIRSKSAYA
jgi:N4-gp56 family major capsid protein